MPLSHDVQFLSSVVYQMRYIHLICSHPPLPTLKHKSRRHFHTCMHVFLSEGSANELSVDGGTSTLFFFPAPELTAGQHPVSAALVQD